MGYALNPGLLQGKPAIMINSEPEPIMAGELLRTMKAAFPDLYRQVWYEFDASPGKRFGSDLILPGGVNGHAKDVGPITGLVADELGSGEGSGEAGQDDVPGEVS